MLATLPATAPAASAVFHTGAPDVTLRHLRTPAEIAAIAHLRENIDLSAHARAADFELNEKKGMPAASSVPSSAAAS